MLTAEAAKKIGINACIDKLGRDFVMAHKDGACSAYGQNEFEVSPTGSASDTPTYIGMYCFVGVEDNPRPIDSNPTSLILDSTSQFPYRASCIINMEDGSTQFLEVVAPCSIPT